MTATPLTRAAAGQPAPPVRIVHLGIGAFARAHQAWYTAHADDAAEWGIAAFTGRGPEQAERLAAQDGLYCLVVRGAEGDRVEVVGSVVEAHDGADLPRLAALLADPAVAVVTLTITEGGHGVTAHGAPDLDRAEVRADLAVLAAALEGRAPSAVPSLPLARLVLALDARRRAGGGAVAVVPCDNLPGNGAVVARAVAAFAAPSPALVAWIDANVSFVSTSVDRITPRAEPPLAVVEAAGWLDRASVVTEPFADWVLAGAFPAGRPAWESAGARFVADIEPWELRKLWLLNGAHSIMSFLGQERGRTTVAEAIADPTCRALVDAFWAEAVDRLPVGTEHEQYRRDLLERFANPRIEHRLTQIAGDATTKARIRFAAVALRSLAAGADAGASARAVASWIRATVSGVVPADTDATRAAMDDADPVHALVAVLSQDLAADAGFVALVREDVGRRAEQARSSGQSPSRSAIAR